MFLISLTILFRSGMSRFMDEHVKKLRLLLKFAVRVTVLTGNRKFVDFVGKCGETAQGARYLDSVG
jgi:hypothetical protein